MGAGFRKTNKGPATKAAVAALTLKQPEKGTGTGSPTEQLRREVCLTEPVAVAGPDLTFLPPSDLLAGFPSAKLNWAPKGQATPRGRPCQLASQGRKWWSGDLEGQTDGL